MASVATSSGRDAAIRAEVARLAGVRPSCRQMAAAIGCSPTSVFRAYRRLGVPPSAERPRRVDPLIRIRVTGATYDELDRRAKRRGMTVPQLAGHVLETIVVKRGVATNVSTASHE